MTEISHNNTNNTDIILRHYGWLPSSLVMFAIVVVSAGGSAYSDAFAACVTRGGSIVLMAMAVVLAVS